jgi:hypothetical protein
MIDNDALLVRVTGDDIGDDLDRTGLACKRTHRRVISDEQLLALNHLTWPNSQSGDVLQECMLDDVIDESATLFSKCVSHTVGVENMRRRGAEIR